MNARRLTYARALTASHLRRLGFKFCEIAEVFGLKTKAGRPWKERARQLEGKGRRLERQERARCTCPASVDITFTGHLPDCPLSYL